MNEPYKNPESLKTQLKFMHSMEFYGETKIEKMYCVMSSFPPPVQADNKKPRFYTGFQIPYEILISLEGFSLASSFFGMTTCRMPSLWLARILSGFTVCGRVKERLKE